MSDSKLAMGRFEDLQASGQLERLLRSGARFAAKAMVLSAVADDAAGHPRWEKP